MLCKDYESASLLVERLEVLKAMQTPQQTVHLSCTIAEYNFIFGEHKKGLYYKASDLEAEVLKREAIKLFNKSIDSYQDVIKIGKGKDFGYVPEIRTIEAHFGIARVLMHGSEVALKDISPRLITKDHITAKSHYKAIINFNKIESTLERYIAEKIVKGEITTANHYKKHLISVIKMKGIVYNCLGQEHEALETFTKITEIDPKSHDGFWNISICLKALNENAKAIEYALKSQKLLEEELAQQEYSEREKEKLNTNKYLLYQLIGKALRDLGKLEEAKKYFIDAAQLKEDEFAATYELAETYNIMGQTAMAKMMLESLLAKHPNNIFMLNSLADLCYSGNAYDQALALYTKIIRQPVLSEVDICRANTRIGLILFSQNKFDDALDILLVSNTIEASEHVVRIWLIKENYEEALRAYKKLPESLIKCGSLKHDIVKAQKIVDDAKVSAKLSESVAKETIHKKAREAQAENDQPAEAYKFEAPQEPDIIDSLSTNSQESIPGSVDDAVESVCITAAEQATIVRPVEKLTEQQEKVDEEEAAPELCETKSNEVRDKKDEDGNNHAATSGKESSEASTLVAASPSYPPTEATEKPISSSMSYLAAEFIPQKEDHTSYITPMAELHPTSPEFIPAHTNCSSTQGGIQDLTYLYSLWKAAGPPDYALSQWVFNYEHGNLPRGFTSLSDVEPYVIGGVHYYF